MDLQKLAQEDFQLSNSSFSLEPLWKEFVTSIKERSLFKKQTFTSYYDRALPSRVVVDGQKLLKVFYAIVDNAVKFTPIEGKIEIAIHYDKTISHLCFTCIDTGIGIDLGENQEKIFDIHQIEDVMTKYHSGIGIGLTIVSKIIKLMNGSIMVKSSLGKGSSFTINIPVEI